MHMWLKYLGVAREQDGMTTARATDYFRFVIEAYTKFHDKEPHSSECGCS